MYNNTNLSTKPRKTLSIPVDIDTEDTIVLLNRHYLPSSSTQQHPNIEINISNIGDYVNNRKITFIFSGFLNKSTKEIEYSSGFFIDTPSGVSIGSGIIMDEFLPISRTYDESTRSIVLLVLDTTKNWLITY